MTLTGPQKYPPASTAYWYGDTYQGSPMEVNVVVWHTTEGKTLPSYGGGTSAPNLTAVPDFANRKLRWYQHFDIDRSSRALVNQSGGVETNTANAVQIELVGTCDRATSDRWGGQAAGGHIFWPDAPDWALAEVAKLVNWLHAEHGVKIQSTVTWKSYPSSYGNSSARLTGAQWNAYYGHLGHQHVPENSHGDPGNINFARIIEHALGAGAEVALTTDDVKKIFNTDGVIASPDGGTNAYWALASYTRETYLKARSAEALAKTAGSTAALARKDVAAVKVTVDAIKAKVDQIAVAGVDVDALAVKVADLLAARLAD